MTNPLCNEEDIGPVTPDRTVNPGPYPFTRALFPSLYRGRLSFLLTEAA